MKAQDISAIFTNTVTTLLAQGYQINLPTMGGSQGELARVDLTKGSEILRVYADTEYDWRLAGKGYISIRVGRCTQQLRNAHAFGFMDTLWNSRLEIISEIKLAQVGEDWYLPADSEELQTVLKKREARLLNPVWEYKSTRYTQLGDAYKEVALRWIRKQVGRKRTKLEDITRMYRIEVYGERPHFEIEVLGVRYYLH